MRRQTSIGACSILSKCSNSLLKFDQTNSILMTYCSDIRKVPLIGCYLRAKIQNRETTNTDVSTQSTAYWQIFPQFLSAFKRRWGINAFYNPLRLFIILTLEYKTFCLLRLCRSDNPTHHHSFAFFAFFTFLFFLSSTYSPCIASKARGSLISKPSLCALIDRSLASSFCCFIVALFSRILLR